jgi:hypothetical protein
MNIRPSRALKAVLLESATPLAYWCQGAVIWVKPMCI